MCIYLSNPNPPEPSRFRARPSLDRQQPSQPIEDAQRYEFKQSMTVILLVSWVSFFDFHSPTNQAVSLGKDKRGEWNPDLVPLNTSPHQHNKPPSMSATWLVTGANRGIGLGIVQLLVSSSISSLETNWIPTMSHLRHTMRLAKNSRIRRRRNGARPQQRH